MDTQNKLFLSFFLFFFITLITGFQVVVQASTHHHHHHHHHLHQGNSGVVLSKLFVFGDSYADTGNSRKRANSWVVPYGTTFPGKPTGRFSDGRVFPDYIASFIKIKSPIPYKWRKFGLKLLPNGMNFAYGGTGVFDTTIPAPNMTTQINLFEKLLHDGVYTKRDLDTSIAHLSASGNDYYAYTSKNGSVEGLIAFIPTVVNQIVMNLKRVHELGVRKLTITALPPLGCLPRGRASTNQNCNETENTAVIFHNNLLQEAVAKLNNETDGTPYVILDFYGAFMSAFKSQGDHPGTPKFLTPLKPCCVGVTSKYNCGSLDANGTKKYTVCENPKSTFFWDTVHPTDQGWHQVYSVLQDSLHQLYY